MKKISSFALCALLMSCSFSKNEKSGASDVIVKEDADFIKQEISKECFDKELTYPGSGISFKVSIEGDSLMIQPSGLSVSNETLYHDINGYTVVNAEIGDLNIDSYPEVFVYLTSDGSGSYGKLIGYSVNNGKSVSYKEGDSNANPTGGMRQIQYKLVDGENGRILKIDKVMEF